MAAAFSVASAERIVSQISPHAGSAITQHQRSLPEPALPSNCGTNRSPDLNEVLIAAPRIGSYMVDEVNQETNNA